MTRIVFLLCVLAALADVLGGLLVFKNYNQRQLQTILGLGAGFLLGATVLDRLPESIHELPNYAPLIIIVGYLTLLYIDRYCSHNHGNLEVNRSPEHHHINPVTLNATIIALTFHAFLDGVIIAGAFIISHSVGLLVFLAIILHKIPEGLNVSSLSLSSGHTRKMAFFTSICLALSTLLGAIITMQFTITSGIIIKILMSLATGSLLYISTSGIIPSLKGNQSSVIFSVIAGTLCFYLSLLFIKSIGLN